MYWCISTNSCYFIMKVYKYGSYILVQTVHIQVRSPTFNMLEASSIVVGYSWNEEIIIVQGCRWEGNIAEVNMSTVFECQIMPCKYNNAKLMYIICFCFLFVLTELNLAFSMFVTLHHDVLSPPPLTGWGYSSDDSILLRPLQCGEGTPPDRSHHQYHLAGEDTTICMQDTNIG